MSYTLKQWKHPQTGEKRVYINGEKTEAKVWLSLGPGGGCYINFKASMPTDFGHVAYEKANQGKTLRQLAMAVAQRAVDEYMDYEEGEMPVGDLPFSDAWKNALDD